MLMASSAGSAELIVLSGQGATPGVREVAAAFARTSGHKVTVLQPANAELAQRLDNGPADLLVGSPEPLEDLVKKGRLVPDTVTPWVLAGLGVSVRAGAPKPDIGTVEAYKAVLIAAKSIGYSYGCSGTNVAEGIEKLGLSEQLKPKTTRTGSQGGGGPVTDYLARGDFELGIQQSNIMVGVPGTDYVGPVPGFLNKPCPSSVAMPTVSREPEAARAMIQVHDLARGRAARAQDLRGAGGTLTQAPLGSAG
jgi:molybdate transport system substrate-binding protein